MQTHHILFVIWFAVVGVWLLNQFNRKNKKVMPALSAP